MVPLRPLVGLEPTSRPGVYNPVELPTELRVLFPRWEGRGWRGEEEEGRGEKGREGGEGQGGTSFPFWFVWGPALLEFAGPKLNENRPDFGLFGGVVLVFNEI